MKTYRVTLNYCFHSGRWWHQVQVWQDGILQTTAMLGNRKAAERYQKQSASS